MRTGSVVLFAITCVLGACADGSKRSADQPAGSADQPAAAAEGTLWDRMCAAVPAQADHDAALAALAAVPGAKEERPELFAVLEDAPRCQRLGALKTHASQVTGSEWVCPALDASLACDPKDDLAWVCERAQDFTAAATGPLTADDQASFQRELMAGRRPSAPGQGQAAKRPAGKLFVPPEDSQDAAEHEFHPSLAEGGQQGCELYELFEAHAKKADVAAWSCPALKVAVGCDG